MPTNYQVNVANPLGGLNQAIGGYIEREQAQNTLNQASEILKTGDTDAIADFMLKNPQAAAALSNVSNFRSQATKQNAVESAVGVLTGQLSPEDAINSRANFIRSQGGDPSDTEGLRSVAGDPEAAKRAAWGTLAVHAPDVYKNLRETLIGDTAEGFTLSPGQTRFDAQGKPIAVGSKDHAKELDRELKLADSKFDKASKLRKEIFAVSSDFRKVEDAFGRIEAATQDPSPAGDLALIFNFMKILDPASVVRESEFATAQNAAGVPERVRNAYNRVFSGERLNPNQRKDFVNQANNLFKSAKKNNDRRVSTILGVGKRNDISEIDLIGDIEPETAALPPGVTEEDIEFTMNKHGLSREEVIQRMSP